VHRELLARRAVRAAGPIARMLAIIADPPAAEHVIAQRWRVVQHAEIGDTRTDKRAQHADTETAQSRKHAGGIRCQLTPAIDMHARPQTWPGPATDPWPFIVLLVRRICACQASIQRDSAQRMGGASHAALHPPASH